MIDNGYAIDLAADWLEMETIPPPPKVPTFHSFTETRRDTVKMLRSEIRALVEGVSEEDLLGHDSMPPSV